MRLRRTYPILAGVLLVAVSLAALVFLRKHAPPEPARLLPGAEGFVYIDFSWLRRAGVGKALPPVTRDPDYQQFVEATGFQFENDLNEVALAIHYPPPGAPAPPEGGTNFRYSEVFTGRVDGDRLRAYLERLSGTREDYRSVTIYSIPLEGRTARVAILGVDTVAASNHPDPAVIHGIVDRSRQLASPFAGPSLLRQFYRQVPLASVAWTIFQAQPPSPGTSTSPLDPALLFDQPATVVASVRYLGSIHVRAEAFTGSDEAAKQLADRVSALLNIFRTAESTIPNQPDDADLRDLFNNLNVESKGQEAVLTAVVPKELARKLVERPSTEAAPAPPPASSK